ncbi:hypothetical protein VMCG_08032 [Cytospora schulzeri]|uniref:Uncharacterized protein n=1 Tax=Cytospora schulzeri TaxID=448051 RepID=A0A423VYC4_9PEZI|nr:hypothetical protein VMCG_08032 [Valsa malicola]
MAEKATEWRDVEMIALHNDIKILQELLEVSAPGTPRIRAPSGPSISEEQAMQNVREDLDRIVPHSFNHTASRSGVVIKGVALGPARQLHAALKRLIMSKEDTQEECEDEVHENLVATVTALNSDQPHHQHVKTGTARLVSRRNHMIDGTL